MIPRTKITVLELQQNANTKMNHIDTIIAPMDHMGSSLN